MLYQAHRFKLVLALSLTLAAVAAAPAAAMFAGPLGPQPVPPRTQSSLCSEVCSGGGYARPTQTRSAILAQSSLCSEVCGGRGYGRVTQAGSAAFAASKPVSGPAVGHSDIPQGTLNRHSRGFAWGDAGIGAGAAVALLVIIVGGAGAASALRTRRVGRSGATVTG